MATPAQIIATVAALQNDSAQDVYTNAACLPYLNMAMRALQEEFQLNDIPVFEDVSAILEVDAGVDAIGFATTPALPSNLVEIKQLWESPRDLNQFLPMQRRDFLPHYLETDTMTSNFGIWAWISEEIRVIAASADNDLKLDYLKTRFATVTIGTINTDIGVINSQSYLEFKTAALCSMFIGENETRAQVLESQAQIALDRVLGVNIKGRQSIRTRRRPFRAAYKSRYTA